MGGITENYYKYMKPNEKFKEQPRGKELVNLLKGTCNTVIMMRVLMEKVTLIDTPPLRQAEIVDFSEGVVDEVMVATSRK